jgi:hypothetical protein
LPFLYQLTVSPELEKSAAQPIKVNNPKMDNLAAQPIKMDNLATQPIKMDNLATQPIKMDSRKMHKLEARQDKAFNRQR